MKIIDRDIENIVLALSTQYPVITLTGPRQSGKTTLVKKLFPDKQYISLENPDNWELAQRDPRELLSRLEGGAILDEVQRAPLLMSYLQEIVDTNQISGEYILTGSNQFSLLSNLTQSLAGRTALLKLLPFSLNELGKHVDTFSSDDLMYHGFYPGIYKQQREPVLAYQMYYETYVQRDVRQLINIKDMELFQKFVRLCAGRIGQIWNASHLANEVGVSVPTINSWISILQASYIALLLQPYYENINKRLIKSPKLYFYDVGLAAYLLGIENRKQMMRDPLRGALFENMVLIELVKARYNIGMDHNLFFFRDSHQNEVDIVRKKAHMFVPMEIKSAQTFNYSFFDGLHYFKKMFPERIEAGYVIYGGKIEQKVKGFEFVNFRRAKNIMDS